jgi:hypothetical protein
LSTAGPPGPTAAGPPGQVVSAMAPGQAVVAGPPGQAVSAAAPGHAVAASAVGPVMAVTPSGVAAPGLQNQPAALNNVHVPPGLSKAPGQAGNPPGNANGHSK